MSVHRHEPLSASECVGIIAREEHDLACFRLNGVLGLEPKQEPASDHIVVGDELDRRFEERGAILRCDPRGYRERRCELGVEEHAADEVNRAKHFRERIGHVAPSCRIWTIGQAIRPHGHSLQCFFGLCSPQ